MATKLILIRHGQTDSNLEKRYSGFLDVELNQKGKRQAVKLRRRLSGKIKIHRVYSSDLKRAREFAGIIFKGAKIGIMAGLRELNFGIFEGLTYKEIMKKYPGTYKKWLNDPLRFTIPKGENLCDFKKRVVRSFRKIASLNKNKTAAIVCHGGTISIFINHILRANDFLKHIPQPAGLRIVEYKNDKG